MIRKLTHLFKNKKGYTLVELMVSFTLTAIFMTAAVVVISSFYKIYYRTNNIAQTTSVSDMLMENITSELSLAALYPWNGEQDAKPIQIEKYPNSIDNIKYSDKNGNSVIMTVAKTKGTDVSGLLQLEYVSQVAGGESVKWEYSDKVYVNNKITKLTFTKGKGKTITIEMTLYNEKTGYSANSKRVIECFNMESDSDIAEENKP